MVRKTLLIAGLMLASCGGGSSDPCTTLWNSLERIDKETDTCAGTPPPADLNQEVTADVQACHQAAAQCTAADNTALGKVANCFAELPDVNCSWTDQQATDWENQLTACTDVTVSAACQIQIPNPFGN
jgi:hypothetical protein